VPGPRLRRAASAALGLALLVGLPLRAASQERGAAALGEAILGLGVNMRVLLIGAHPDDEDTFLIAWLSRGRHVETAYLSLTRGDGGQNLIGNELGEALGVIRTEELLAARRIDGARQYFTRAFDFGFSKDTTDTYTHWPKDSILRDIVAVVRRFRPHVIVGVFSGTPRDGHGHHQVSGLLAREAFEVAGDTLRFPPTLELPAWTPLKFYRAARFNAESSTLRVDVGEYSPVLGRSYAEIAGESRSQHKSQGFGVLQRKGQLFDFVRREASRVNEQTPASSERSIFDGLDTTWARFRPIARTDVDPTLVRTAGLASTASARQALDSLPSVLAAIQRSYDVYRPARLVPFLVRALRLASIACPLAVDAGCVVAPAAGRSQLRTDMGASFETLRTRLEETLWLAAGLDLEALAPRDAFPVKVPVPIAASLYNRGEDTVWIAPILPGAIAPAPARVAAIPAGGVWRDSAVTPPYLTSNVTQPSWLVRPRRDATFDTSEPSWVDQPLAFDAILRVGRGDDTISIDKSAPIVQRVADPVRGELRRAVAIVPAISVTLDQQIQFAPANAPLDRQFEVRLRSAEVKPRDVRVTLVLPRGVAADSVMRTVRLEGYDERRNVVFRVRGHLPPGEHVISASAESDGQSFGTGYDVLDYDHIRRQRLYRPARTTLSAVDFRIPRALRVGYIAGVGDNVAPTLADLGIPVTTIRQADLSRANLATFSTIVIGPRAYEAHPELRAANARLVDFVQRGGTLVVQYGQTEMAEPGVMPYPIALGRPADRVTQEDAPVRVIDQNAPELRAPNRISAADFEGWVQERGLYMPRTFDQHYRALFEMSDPGEPPNRGAVLITKLGRGTYIYTTLSFFRQLPAGVPGAARLFVNLLSAGLPSTPSSR
jgi:LmbE family N-acetylglucosaminyl deacetylase